MVEQSFFDKVSSHQTHVPDVLSCIANLSNDEVFTPPEVVNKMLDLLPQELFANPDTTFLDPATKTGVFLREIAKRCLEAQLPGYAERSEQISEKKSNNIPLDDYDEAFEKQLQDKIDHIFHKQLYGIGITELTSLLARRSLYCSKYPNGPYSITHFDDAEGNIRFRRTEHVWKNGTCIWCGASQGQYDRDKALESHAYEFIHIKKPEDIFKMKFDVIISNPPYQLNVGSGGKGSGTAIPIYQHFIRQAKKLTPRYISMIIPARWFSSGRGLDDFREEMLNDNNLVKIVDYADSKECFPGVDIAGGICYFLWDKNAYNPLNECEITNICGNWKETQKRKFNEFPTFIRDNRAVDIVKKVVSKEEPTMQSTVYPVSLFGLNTNIELKTVGDYQVKSSNGMFYCQKDDVRAGMDIINKYKVFIAASSYDHAGQPDKNGQRRIISSNGILPPGTIVTSTYIIVQAFDNVERAKNMLSYLKTRFVRFLMAQICISQHVSRDTFKFVPIPDCEHQWSDIELYKKYNITDDEIKYIETMIRPMDSSNGGDEN